MGWIHHHPSGLVSPQDGMATPERHALRRDVPRSPCHRTGVVTTWNVSTGTVSPCLPGCRAGLRTFYKNPGSPLGLGAGGRERSRLLEDLRQPDLQPWQERTGKDVAQEELGREAQPSALPPVDPGGPPVRIEQPVLPHSEAFVALELEPLVVISGALGEDLDDEIRSPLD